MPRMNIYFDDNQNEKLIALSESLNIKSKEDVVKHLIDVYELEERIL